MGASYRISRSTYASDREILRHMKRWMIAMAAALVPGVAQSQQHANLRAAVEQDYVDNLAGLFEYFHRNPELSFREEKTAARLAAELRALGVEVTEGVGGTGIVGILANGEGPLVLVRADMECLDGSGKLLASLEGYECVLDPSLKAAFANNQSAVPLQQT